MKKRKLRKAITKKVYAVKLMAPNDTNGNPRRAWILYDRDGKYLGAVDEGYQGRGALKAVAPNYVELANINVAAIEYNSLRTEFVSRD